MRGFLRRPTSGRWRRWQWRGFRFRITRCGTRCGEADRSKDGSRRGQKWRTGVEGRISVLKRRHGLNRSRYRGLDRMRRWVGLGVTADKLINIGNRLEAET